MTNERISPGVGGAGAVRRLYRRSPARWLYRVALPHRGLAPEDVFVASFPRSGSTWLRDWLKLSIDRPRAEAVAARCSFAGMQASERRELDSDHPALPATAIRSRLPTVRDGRVGGWRAALTDAQQRRFAAWVDALALMGYPPA